MKKKLYSRGDLFGLLLYDVQIMKNFVFNIVNIRKSKNRLLDIYNEVISNLVLTVNRHFILKHPNHRLFVAHLV